MSSYMGDLTAYMNANAASGTSAADTKTAKKNGYDLSMEDFLQLMMVELQNQTIDDTADTGEMLNQMVQMQMVTALSNMTDASVMSYAGSMVGKEVTVGNLVDGKLEERVVTITGTGTSNGEQVVFAGDEVFKLSDIMAIGRLPNPPEDVEEGGEDEDTGTGKPVEGTGGAEGSNTGTTQNGAEAAGAVRSVG